MGVINVYFGMTGWAFKMQRFRILVVSAAVWALAGCSGMSANECELADWRAVGYEDGAQGRSTDRFGTYRKSCADHAVAPDFQAYQSGREAGLREYCRPENGYREGARGVTYTGACPVDLEAAFHDRYLDGQTLYTMQSAVNTTNHKLQKRRSRIDKIEKELAQAMTSVLTGEISGQNSAVILVETKQLAEERVRLDSEVGRLENQLRKEEAELEAHREQVDAHT
jgi:hypothetical protein